MSEKEVFNINELIEKLKGTLQFLLKKWITIVLIISIGAILGLIYSMRQKPVYNSSLTFVIEGESMGGGLSGLASTFGLGRMGGSQGVFSSANILALLKSRKLVEKTLLQPLSSNRKKTYAELYFKFSGLQETFEKNPELKSITFKPDTDLKKLTPAQNIVLGAIYASIVQDQLNVEIKNPDNTIINIDIKSINEEFSRHFPEELIKIVSEYYIETKTKKAKSNYLVIKQLTDSVRIELNNAITGVATANDNTFLLNPAFNVKRVPSVHKEVNVQANQAILTELVKNLELARMNLLNETPFIEIIDTPVSPIPADKLAKSKAIVIGGFLGGFLIIGYLVVLNYVRNRFASTQKGSIN